MNTQTLSVGDEVRVYFASTWYDGEVVFEHDGEPIIYVDVGGALYQPAKHFTEIESRVSEEDRAVEDMRSLLNEEFKAPNQKPSRVELCRFLYRAGYRKQPPVDMDDPANWREGDVFRATKKGFKYPWWTRDKDYVAFKSLPNESLCVMDDQGDHREIAILVSEGNIRLHHRP